MVAVCIAPRVRIFSSFWISCYMLLFWPILANFPLVIRSVNSELLPNWTFWLSLVLQFHFMQTFILPFCILFFSNWTSYILLYLILLVVRIFNVNRVYFWCVRIIFTWSWKFSLEKISSTCPYLYRESFALGSARTYQPCNSVFLSQQISRTNQHKWLIKPANRLIFWGAAPSSSHVTTLFSPLP